MLTSVILKQCDCMHGHNVCQYGQLANATDDANHSQSDIEEFSKCQLL